MTKPEIRTLADRFLTHLARYPASRKRLEEIGRDKDTKQIPRLMTEYINELLSLDPDPLHVSQFEELAAEIRAIVAETPIDLIQVLQTVKPYSSPVSGPTGKRGTDPNQGTGENGENTQKT